MVRKAEPSSHPRVRTSFFLGHLLIPGSPVLFLLCQAPDTPVWVGCCLPPHDCYSARPHHDNKVGSSRGARPSDIIITTSISAVWLGSSTRTPNLLLPVGSGSEVSQSPSCLFRRPRQSPTVPRRPQNRASPAAVSRRSLWPLGCIASLPAVPSAETGALLRVIRPRVNLQKPTPGTQRRGSLHHPPPTLSSQQQI